MKERLDILVVKRGLTPSREKAKALIMSGDIFVNGEVEIGFAHFRSEIYLGIE